MSTTAADIDDDFIVRFQRLLESRTADTLTPDFIDDTRRKLLFAEQLGQKLWDNPLSSDIILHLKDPGGKAFIFHAHRNLCSTRTNYFENAMTNGFREANNGEFHFETYDSQAVLRVMQYIYTGDYSVLSRVQLRSTGGTPGFTKPNSSEATAPPTEVSEITSLTEYASHSQASIDGSNIRTDQGQRIPRIGPRLIAHLHVHAMADMLLMSALRDLAERRFKALWTQSGDVVRGSDICHCIKEIWTNMGHNDGLKDIVLTYVAGLSDGCTGSLKKRKKLAKLVETQEFKDLLLETDFGGDLALKFLRRNL